MLDALAFVIVTVVILVLICLALLFLWIVGLGEEREEGPRAILVGLWRLVKWPLSIVVVMTILCGGVALVYWAFNRTFH